MRLRALSNLAKAMAGVHRYEDVARRMAVEAREALGAATLSIGVWERERGQFRVLVNVGDPTPGEKRHPEDERYPVSDFPELLTLDDRAEKRIYRLDDPGLDPEHASRLRRHGGRCALVVPIVLEGRAWGELYATRRANQPDFDTADADFAGVVAAQISAGLLQAAHFERIRRLAYEDPLTGLANRRAIDERLDVAIDRHRSDGTAVSLIVCDVNGLKRLNDERGHDVGDSLLIRFASLLSAVSAMLPGSIAGRLGGDEFCIVAEGHRADAAVEAALRLCQGAREISEGEGVACGVASTGDPVGPVTAPDHLFRLADAAQYRAKRARSPEPVVAGRGQPPDPTVRLVHSIPATRAGDRPLPSVAGPDPGGRDRRRFRSAAHPDAGRALSVGLATLDERAAVGSLPRLEALTDAVARMVNAAGWRVSHVPAGRRAPRVVRSAAYRNGDAQVSGETRAPRDPGRPTLGQGGYPRSEAALTGRGFVVEVGEPGNDPAEEAALVAGGYRAMLLAGACGDDGGWLVEIFADEISTSLHGLEPVLRSLVSVALTGAAPRPAYL